MSAPSCGAWSCLPSRCAAADRTPWTARSAGSSESLDIIRPFAPVAQLDRVPGYEPGGRGFKSCRARQFLQALSRVPLDLLTSSADFSQTLTRWAILGRLAALLDTIVRVLAASPVCNAVVWQIERGEEMTTQEAQFNVGGVRLARPFRIRRLGHFGVNVRDPEASRDFYCRLLGFRISDPLDFGPRLPEAARAKVGPTIGYFARHGTDHHSFVFFPRGAYSALNEWAKKPQGTINQITWQVGSLREISDAFDWFTRRGKPIRRAGRDLPGSNWHFYPPDPEGHINELYYGIEQIGWDGYSKPREMYGVRYTKPPQLPHKSELAV